MTALDDDPIGLKEGDTLRFPRLGLRLKVTNVECDWFDEAVIRVHTIKEQPERGP